MSEISRRDFLNGTALAIAAGLTPAMQVSAQPSRYPPVLTGLRGQHVGAFEAAHALVRAPAHDVSIRWAFIQGVMDASVPIPKFVSSCSDLEYELRNRKDTCQVIKSSVALVQKSASRTRQKNDADF